MSRVPKMLLLTCCMVVFGQVVSAIDPLELLIGKSSSVADTGVYSLQSIEGKSSNVRLIPDIEHGRLYLVVDSGNSICLGPYAGLVDSNRVLNHKFLELRLWVRGGSDVTVRRSVLICVSNGKAEIAADITSEVTSVFSGIWDEIADSSVFQNEPDAETFYVAFSTSEDSRNFNLKAAEYHLVKPTFDSAQYVETVDTTQFTFDAKTGSFVNAFDSLTGEFRIIADDDNSERLTVFQGRTFPTMKFKSGNTYFKVDGVWYKRGRDNFLIEHSYSCEEARFEHPTEDDSM